MVAGYGYPAVFFGAIFEGETVMILSGLFAHQGYLSLPAVAVVAFLGTMIGDGTWFLIGRYRVPRRLHQSGWFKRISSKPLRFVNSDTDTLTLTMRFMYGFRTLIPLGLGMSEIPTWRFFTLLSVGTLAWIFVYAGIGFFFGGFLELLFGRIRHGELALIAVVVIVVVAAITAASGLRRLLRRRLAAATTEEK